MPDASYVLTDLGRPAIFFIPSYKLLQRCDGITAKELLHRFLFAEYGAYTTTLVPQFGLCKNGSDEPVYDECVQYRVSFAGPERIPKLLAKLAEIARLIGEECIYVEAGQYACLVSPNPVHEKPH